MMKDYIKDDEQERVAFSNMIPGANGSFQWCPWLSFDIHPCIFDDKLQIKQFRNRYITGMTW